MQITRLFLVLVCIGPVLAQFEYDNCTISVSESCDLARLTGPTVIFPGGDTGCLEEDSPYSFQVNPGSGEDASNVILYFHGGGMCVTPECIPTSPKTVIRRVNRFTMSGIFRTIRAENPFKDWTMVLVGYCSGDSHVGDKEATEGTVAFNGRTNTKSVLEWFYANIPSPDRLLLTGHSAGSVGAQYWSHAILSAYRDTGTIASVIYEGTVGGFLTRETSLSIGVDIWKMCADTDFGWTPEQVEACKNYDWDITDVQKMTHASHKDVPFLFANYKYDDVTRLFCRTFGLSNCWQARFYRADIRLLVGYIGPVGDNNVVTFFMNGPEHGILWQNEIYNYLGGQVIEALELLAYRGPSTVIGSYCVRPWWARFIINPSVWEFGCNGTLTSAEFRP